MKVNNLKELYLHQLRDIYDAETQLTKALPEMAKNASHEDVRSAFEEHLEVTRNQIERLDQIFRSMNEGSKRTTCVGMKGLIEEGREMLKKVEDPDALDAGLLASAQKVEHYEISAYGTARTYAELLGEDEAAQLLQETLDEEEETDRRLTELALEGINREAIGEEEEE